MGARIERPDPVSGVDKWGRAWSYAWGALDPDKAELGAQWGLAGPHGLQFILWPHSVTGDVTLTAIGLWSGLWPQSADSIVREINGARAYGAGNLGRDRRISKADWAAWQA